MPLPNLEGLPGWAQVLAIAVFAICAGGGGWLMRVGWIRGKNAEPGKQAEIAAVTLDASAIDKLAGEAAGLIVILTSLKGVGYAQLEVHKEQVAEMRRLHEELRMLAREIRDASSKI